MYLLVQAFQHLWLVMSHEVYQQFTYVGHTTKPGTLSASMLAIYLIASRRRLDLFGRVTLFLSALYSGQ